MIKQKRQQIVTIMEMENSYSKSSQEEINRWNMKKHDEVRKTDINNTPRKDNSKLIIDETTIYEIDLNCYECLKNRRY